MADTARAKTYRQTIVAARARQLRLHARNVRRLMHTYSDAADSIVARLRQTPAHALDEDARMEQVYLQTILGELEHSLRQFQSLFAERLRGGMLELAQAAVTREARVLALGVDLSERDPILSAEMSQTITEPDGSTATIQYGRVAHDAIEALAVRYYGDGLRLSDRIYGVDQTLRRGVEQTVMQSVAEGLTIGQTIDRLVDGPLSAHAQAANRAAVIARTEIAQAYNEAHIRSAKDPDTGAYRDGVTGLVWHLSSSHPAPDICDVWATYDEGRGQGVYYTTPPPSDHPNGLCFMTTAIDAIPETRTFSTGAIPNVDGLSSEHVQYYADAGDPVAQAFLAGAKA